MMTGTSRIALALLGFVVLGLGALFFLLGDLRTGEAALAQPGSGLEDDGGAELARSERAGGALKLPMCSIKIP